MKLLYKLLGIFWVIASVLTMPCCESFDKSTEMQIYHLQPDVIERRGAYYKQVRNDFFVVKNFDIENEIHKNQIDTFVIQRLDNEGYLTNNKRVKWNMTFFKYGKGINKNTSHYDIRERLVTEYEEIGSYIFDNEKGYLETFFWEDYRNLLTDDSKREVIQSYFDK